MTGDRFNEAAREEAAQRYRFADGYESGVYQRRAFVAGVEWAEEVRPREGGQAKSAARIVDEVLSVLTRYRLMYYNKDSQCPSWQIERLDR